MTLRTAETPTAATSVRVDFVSPMPGLDPYTAFTLEPIPEAEGLHALRAVEADVRLFLLEPIADRYGYAPQIPDSARSAVGVVEGADLRLFVVANPAADGVYLNLRAPIVVGQDGRAVQVILEDQAYPVRALLGS